MSSILNALKKIESRKSETRLPTWPYRINNRESMSRHTNRIWRRHKILGILIVVCTVALAGKLYFGSRPGLESRTPEAELPEKTVSTAVSGDNNKTAPPRAETNERPASLLPPAPRDDSAHTTMETMDTPPAEAVIKAAVDIPETTPPDNAGLTLQALVWSEQPEERFVVINDTILRDGGTVNGSVVTRIEPDYVIIRTDGTTWRLKYGH